MNFLAIINHCYINAQEKRKSPILSTRLAPEEKKIMKILSVSCPRTKHNKRVKKLREATSSMRIVVDIYRE